MLNVSQSCPTPRCLDWLCHKLVTQSQIQRYFGIHPKVVGGIEAESGVMVCPVDDRAWSQGLVRRRQAQKERRKVRESDSAFLKITKVDILLVAIDESSEFPGVPPLGVEKIVAPGEDILPQVERSIDIRLEVGDPANTQLCRLLLF